jgi:tetratricopeptide (TPR) repeat protein
MTGDAGPSLFVAAVFGLHPLHVESVAWVSERKDVLSTFFFMLTLCAYAAWAETLRKRWLFAATVCMGVGLLAKPMLVTLPCVLLLLDYWPLRRVWCENRARCLTLLVGEKAPMFLLAVGASVATVVVQRGAQATSSLDALPLGFRVENAIVAYVRYIGKTIWPADLLIYYPHPLGSLSMPYVLAALCLLVAVSACAYFFRRRAPYFAVGWCWYLGTLVPVIGIVQVGTQAMADRYTYIPMIGLLIIFSWGIGDLVLRRRERMRSVSVAISACALLAVLAALTWSRIGVWRNSETLYRATVRTMPDNSVGNMGLGLVLVDGKRYGEAIPFLETAIAKRHREPEAHYHLGIAYQGLRDLPRAEAQYRAAIDLEPAYSQAWNNLGVTLNTLNRRDEALAALERAVATGPRNEEAVVNLVRYLMQLGRVTEARRCVETASAQLPESSELQALRALLQTAPSNPHASTP